MPNKAVAAGGTTALAGAFTTIIISLFWRSAPPDVATAITTVISAVLAAAATYATPGETKA